MADYGIKIYGHRNTYAEIQELEYDEDYGVAYLIGIDTPYDVYVWSRPDPNAGYLVPYWLNIGPISIEGPEGPVGPEGPKGAPGISNKFLASTTIPSIEFLNVGDVVLITGDRDKGAIYEVRETGSKKKYYVYQGNIQGPQGNKGETGDTGPKGNQGDPGKTGPQGPAGKFVNIIGVLSSPDDKQTPLQLNDTSAAYLIGTEEPYDLWIQVGENPYSAQWFNAGPFNAATAVQVDGSYVEVWNSDSKLDKITTNTEVLLTQKATGATDKLSFSSEINPYYIVRRDSVGRIKVPTAAQGPSYAASEYLVNTRINEARQDIQQTIEQLTGAQINPHQIKIIPDYTGSITREPTFTAWILDSVADHAGSYVGAVEDGDAEYVILGYSDQFDRLLIYSFVDNFTEFVDYEIL